MHFHYKVLFALKSNRNDNFWFICSFDFVLLLSLRQYIVDRGSVCQRMPSWILTFISGLGDFPLEAFKSEPRQ